MLDSEMFSEVRAPVERSRDRAPGNKDALARHLLGFASEEAARLTAGDPGLAGPSPADAFGGFPSLAHLERHRAEAFRAALAAPMMPLSLVVPPGETLTGPPYDHSWATGVGTPFGHSDGSILTFGAGTTGFSASGFSMMLNPTAPVALAATPVGRVIWNWSSFADYPAIRASGGVGVTVYANGQLIIDRKVNLFSVTAPRAFTGAGNDIAAEDVGTPSPLGWVRLFPTYFNMHPGTTYELWFYVWESAVFTAGTAFISTCSAKIPGYRMSAGPISDPH